MVSMANVATNGGTLNLVIVHPLNNPSIAPINNPATMAPNRVKPMNKLFDGISMPFFNKPAVIAPHKANTEPTDKSIPAVSTTNVIPTEIQMFTEICRITFQVLSTVKKFGDFTAKNKHNKKRAIKD